MPNQFFSLIRPSIQQLQAYVPGKSIAQLYSELAINNIIKLSSNENPLGASPKAIEAANKALNEVSVYPDAFGLVLKEELSQYLKVETNQITLGNGSDSLFTLIGQAFLPKNEQVILSQYGFIAYEIMASIMGATLTIIPMKNWHYDLNAMASVITPHTRLIFIANPNNPTGSLITQQALIAFLLKVPSHVLVIIDEAYYEFINHPSYPNTIELQKKFSNLIITRTFSKIYGLASLRVGYAIAHPDIISILNTIKAPFNVSTPALWAAVAALKDREFIEKSNQINQQGMQFLSQQFDKMNLYYLPPSANFITVYFPQKAKQIYENLLQKGIIVRPLLNYGLSDYLRITIGLPEQNHRLIENLALFLKER